MRLVFENVRVAVRLGDESIPNWPDCKGILAAALSAVRQNSDRSRPHPTTGRPRQRPRRANGLLPLPHGQAMPATCGGPSGSRRVPGSGGAGAGTGPKAAPSGTVMQSAPVLNFSTVPVLTVIFISILPGGTEEEKTARRRWSPARSAPTQQRDIPQRQASLMDKAVANATAALIPRRESGACRGRGVTSPFALSALLRPSKQCRRVSGNDRITPSAC